MSQLYSPCFKDCAALPCSLPSHGTVHKVDEVLYYCVIPEAVVTDDLEVVAVVLGTCEAALLP